MTRHNSKWAARQAIAEMEWPDAGNDADDLATGFELSRPMDATACDDDADTDADEDPLVALVSVPRPFEDVYADLRARGLADPNEPTNWEAMEPDGAAELEGLGELDAADDGEDRPAVCAGSSRGGGTGKRAKGTATVTVTPWLAFGPDAQNGAKILHLLLTLAALKAPVTRNEPHDAGDRWRNEWYEPDGEGGAWVLHSEDTEGGCAYRGNDTGTDWETPYYQRPPCGASLRNCPHRREWSRYASIEPSGGPRPLVLADRERQRIERDMQRNHAQTAEQHEKQRAVKTAHRDTRGRRLFPPLGYRLPYDHAAATQWAYRHTPRTDCQLYRRWAGLPTLRSRITPLVPDPIEHPTCYRTTRVRIRARWDALWHELHDQYRYDPDDDKHEHARHKCLYNACGDRWTYQSQRWLEAYEAQSWAHQERDLARYQAAYRAYQVRHQAYWQGNGRRGRPPGRPFTRPFDGCTFLYEDRYPWRGTGWLRVNAPWWEALTPWEVLPDGVDTERPIWLETDWEAAEFYQRFPWGIPLDWVPQWQTWIAEMRKAWHLEDYLPPDVVAAQLGITEAGVRQWRSECKRKGMPVPTVRVHRQVYTRADAVEAYAESQRRHAHDPRKHHQPASVGPAGPAGQAA